MHVVSFDTKNKRLSSHHSDSTSLAVNAFNKGKNSETVSLQIVMPVENLSQRERILMEMLHKLAQC